MKTLKILFFLCACALLVVAAPQPPSYLTVLTQTFYPVLDNPAVEYAMPPGSTNELVVTGQTSIQAPAAGFNGIFYVGCTNVTDISWQTQSNLAYQIMVKTNASDPWTYDQVKVIGDGKVFHFYSVADPRRIFTIRSSPN